MWTSSWDRSKESFPDSISPRISPRAVTIRSASAFGRIPCFPSIRAWAMLPAMSWRYSRTSYGIEAVNSSTNRSVTESNRPPHAFFFAMSPFPVLEHRPDREAQGVDLDEPGRVGLVEHRLLLERREVCAVEGDRALPPRNGDAAFVQLQPRRPG